VAPGRTEADRIGEVCYSDPVSRELVSLFSTSRLRALVRRHFHWASTLEDDLVQTARIGLWEAIRKRANFHGDEGNFRIWAWTVAKRRCIDFERAWFHAPGSRRIEDVIVPLSLDSEELLGSEDFTLYDLVEDTRSALADSELLADLESFLSWLREKWPGGLPTVEALLAADGMATEAAEARGITRSRVSHVRSRVRHLWTAWQAGRGDEVRPIWRTGRPRRRRKADDERVLESFLLHVQALDDAQRLHRKPGRPPAPLAPYFDALVRVGGGTRAAGRLLDRSPSMVSLQRARLRRLFAAWWPAWAAENPSSDPAPLQRMIGRTNSRKVANP
jgi:RNA polymerase sigma factor (sigma-70 family)